jgi:tetratricopeptide (TPR) repeat protein
MLDVPGIAGLADDDDVAPLSGAFWRFVMAAPLRPSPARLSSSAPLRRSRGSGSTLASQAAVVVVGLAFGGSAQADSATTAAAPAPTAAAPAPTPAAPTPAAPTVAERLAEAQSLVESAANTTANLKRAIELYDGVLGDPSLSARARSDGWADVARAYMRLGDLEKSSPAKLALYEKGQDAGRKAEQADATNPAGVFWTTANMACVGRTRGVMNSLFMVGDLRKGMNRALALDANFHFARNTLGEIDHAVPGLAGGSDERAEQGYLEVLRRSPHFTATMVLLARLKKDQGEKDEARQWAQKVLDEKAPARVHDWRKLDVPDARALLASLE